MTDLTPLAKRLTDRAFDQLETAARDRGEPGFEYADLQRAVAAVLRELVARDVYRGEADYEKVADELEGKPVEQWHLRGRTEAPDAGEDHHHGRWAHLPARQHTRRASLQGWRADLRERPLRRRTGPAAVTHAYEDR
ncbi:hypothetical protein [Amycolatopsis sp. cmx-4-83]|uniref:hypothetical protein n=1 Tax=Amycolatopsis sp. cmx-4-83 TaxID=2790940 RepID=UPI00397A8F21